MEYIKFIRTQFETVDNFEDLAKIVGYKANGIADGVTRLRLMAKKSLLGIDDEIYFDGTHGSRSLLNELLSYFKAPIEMKLEMENHLNRYFLKLYLEQEAKRYIHIFIDTSFKRNSQPLVALAMLDNIRYIRKLEYLYDCPLEVQITEVSRIIKEHYAHTATLKLWGSIKQYHYRYRSNMPSIIFDTDGNIIGESNFTESKTKLFIANKLI